MGCAASLFDAETNTRAAAFNRKLCPFGHQLYKRNAAIFTCDGCKKSFFMGEPCYRCVCGVDACEDCYSMQVGCKGDHLLYESRMRQPFKCNICNEEHRRYGTIALSCRKCDFDCCPKHKNDAPPKPPANAPAKPQATVDPEPAPVFKPPQPPQYTPKPEDKFLSLFIGINYPGTDAALSGCVRDVAVSRDAIRKMGFKVEEGVNSRVLVDDRTFKGRTGHPDRASIIDSLNWLVSSAQPGTNVFFHYSGHGAPQRDPQAEEEDGMDECLVPADYENVGLIPDDELFKILQKFPAGCRVTLICDCCHSSSIMDLKYTWKWEGEEKKFAMNNKSRDFKITSNKTMEADAIMISGCMDDQTSADVSNVADFGLYLGKDSPGKAGGALTSGFAAAVQQKFNEKEGRLKVSFMELFYIIQQDLKKRRYTQIPQLSASKKFDMNSDFTLFGPLPQP